MRLDNDDWQKRKFSTSPVIRRAVSGRTSDVVGLAGSAGLGERLASRADGKTKTDSVRTPYGSVDVVAGTIGGGPFAAVAKSGVAPFPSHNLPFRATIFALSNVGCTRFLSASLATSMDPRLRLADCLVADDFIDLTGRSITFFDGGLEGTHHAEMEAPFCARLSREFTSSARSFGMRVAHGGTVATVPGPHHPTMAEAGRLAAMGAIAASFSASTEAKLARELGICFTSAALVVREAAPHKDWRAGGARESSVGGLTEAELLRAFAEGREAPGEAPSPTPSRARPRAKRPGSRGARELEVVKAKLQDADRRLEQAVAAFVPHAAALPPCPRCARDPGPRRA